LRGHRIKAIILCAHSLSQTSAVITTLFNNAECLIEMNLFAELVRRIEKAFDNGGGRELRHSINREEVVSVSKACQDFRELWSVCKN